MDDQQRERMHQMLRRMNVLTDGPASRQTRERMAALAKRIDDQGDDSEQYMALTEFCETLNMATEEIIAAIRPDQFVRPILACLAKEYNIELMLLAARALTYLIDAIPPTSVVVADSNGIAILCDKLRSIVDIDVAEQALTALDKIGAEHPGVILSNDGPSAILGFIDFFSTSTQRKAVACVASVARRCSPANFTALEAVLPQLQQLLRNSDAKIVESALLALLRCVTGVQSDPTKVARAFGEAAPAILEIIEKRALDPSFTTALKITSAVCAFSPATAEQLVEIGLVRVLLRAVAAGTESGGGGGMQGIALPPPGSSPLRSPALGAAAVAVTPPRLSVGEAESPLFASTPPRLGGLSGTPGVGPTAPPPVERALSVEQKTEVCSIFVRLLPRIQEGYMAYCGVPFAPSLPPAVAAAAAAAAAVAAATAPPAGATGKTTTTSPARGGGAGTAPATRAPPAPPTRTASGRGGTPTTTAVATAARATLARAGSGTALAGRGAGRGVGRGSGAAAPPVARGGRAGGAGPAAVPVPRGSGASAARAVATSPVTSRTAPTTTPGGASSDDADGGRGRDDDEDDAHNDDDDDYDDCDDDDYDEDGGGEDDNAAPRLLIDTLAEAGQIALREDPRHVSTLGEPHTCDMCGEGTLRPGNWYRCNEEDDVDMCAKCMILHGVQQSAGGAHTFTDMRALALKQSRAVAAAALSGSPAATAAAMAAAGPGAARATASGGPELTERTPQPCRLSEAMQRPGSKLLESVSQALGAVVQLRIESEHPGTKAACLDFVTRCIHFNTGASLRTLLYEVPLCEFLSSIFASTSEIPVLAPLVHICTHLVKKLPDVYTDAFVRQGVAYSLSSLKSASPTLEALGRNGEPFNRTCATEAGWRALLASEANSIMATFCVSDQSRVGQQLETLAATLRTRGRAAWDEALAALGALMEHGDGVSTFELIGSNVLHEMAGVLRQTPDPASDVVVLFQHLSKRSPGDSVTEGASLSSTFSGAAAATAEQQSSTLAPTALRQSSPPSSFDGASSPLADSGFTGATSIQRLVRHLQTILGQLETFSAQTLSGGAGGAPGVATQQFRLNIVPQSTVAPPAVTTKDDTSDGKKARKETRDAGRGASETAERGANVSIEPLATVGAIADFILQRLIPGAAPPAAAAAPGAGAQPGQGDDEDPVEEILPTEPPPGVAPAASSVGAAGKKAAGGGASRVATGDPPSSVYIRFEGQTLPHHMVMSAVVQRFVRPARAAATTAAASSTAPSATAVAPAGAGAKAPPAAAGTRPVPAPQGPSRTSPAASPATLGAGAAGTGDNEPITLYYSLRPFEGAVKSAEAISGTRGVGGVGRSSAPLLLPRTAGNPGGVINMHAVCEITRALAPAAVATHTTTTSFSPHPSPVPSVSGGSMAMVLDVLLLLRVIYAASANWNSLYHHAVFMDAQKQQPGQLGDSGTEASNPTPDASFSAAMEISIPVPLHEFVNQKLNGKALRFITSASSTGVLDSTWCATLARDCPFLLAFSTRHLLFEVGYHGTARALQRIQERGAATQTLVTNAAARATRVPRLKMRVWRGKVWDCARRVDELHGLSRFIFEFEYYGEEGSGLGPTQEFYAILGKELHRRSLRLWREEGSEQQDDELVQTTLGLFPRPCRNASDGVLKCFRTLGAFLARALLDRRVINMRFSRPVLKALRGDSLVLGDIADVSQHIADVLLGMAAAAKTSAASGSIRVGNQTVNIDDLALSFTLPGDDSVPLCPDGQNRPVEAASMGEYLERVVSVFLGEGIEAQLQALAEGFDRLVPIHSLQMFTLDELNTLFCGSQQRITVAELEAYTVSDHGFTSTSPTVRAFFEVLCEMDLDDQQRFFQFLTGSPMLPVGGLAALRPKFTIVRKTSSDPRISEGDQLPSAMTCQNFLKLPAYDSKDTLRSKLLLAIREGRGVFNFT